MKFDKNHDLENIGYIILLETYYQIFKKISLLSFRVFYYIKLFFKNLYFIFKYFKYKTVKLFGNLFCKFKNKTDYLLKKIKYNFKNKKITIKNIVNYVIPVLAILMCINVVKSYNSLTLAVEVDYNGMKLGYISDSSVFTQAEQGMQQRIIYEEDNPIIDNKTEFSIKMAPKSKLLTVDQLTDVLISNSSNEISEAQGLYIDGNFQKAVENSELINNNLNQKLEAYKTDNPGSIVEFTKKIEIKQGLYLKNSIVTNQEMLNILNSEEGIQKYYTVVKGDSPTLIADKTNTPYSLLKELNPDIENKLIPGQQIVISKSVPFLSVKVIKNLTYNEQIPFETETLKDEKLAKGSTKVEQEGQNGILSINANVTYVNGIEISRDVLNSNIIQPPVNKKVIEGSYVAPTNPSYGTNMANAPKVPGSFIWPVGGKNYISSYWGDGRGHQALDIAAPAGTPIYASAPGKVTLAKTWYGYGKCVIISHGNGVETLYGHASALYVSLGQYVEQGQVIAAVGSTGQSTGNHLHFEVRVNGVKVDPSKYVKK